MAKKPRKFPLLRFRKNDPEHNLLAATQRWVRANGGELLVTGGIGLIHNWDERKFHVTVGCLGRKPSIKSKET